MNAYHNARFWSDMARIRKSKPELAARFEALDEDDKRAIMELCGILTERIKGMGTDGALELLSALGVYFIREGRR